MKQIKEKNDTKFKLINIQSTKRLRTLTRTLLLNKLNFRIHRLKLFFFFVLKKISSEQEGGGKGIEGNRIFWQKRDVS